MADHRVLPRQHRHPVNFGITIALAILVGAVVAGQTFYLFMLENLKHYGALKAIGVTDLRIIGMILLQALVVGSVVYALGMGIAAAFFEITLQVIAGLLDASAGDLVVLGQRFEDLSKQERIRYRRRNPGFVFQQFHLLPALTAAENAAVRSWPPACRGARRSRRPRN